jgi:hypothetical protein
MHLHFFFIDVICSIFVVLFYGTSNKRNTIYYILWDILSQVCYLIGYHNSWHYLAWWMGRLRYILWNGYQREVCVQKIQLALLGYWWSSSNQEWEVQGMISSWQKKCMCFEEQHMESLNPSICLWIDCNVGLIWKTLLHKIAAPWRWSSDDGLVWFRSIVVFEMICKWTELEVGKMQLSTKNLLVFEWKRAQTNIHE